MNFDSRNPFLESQVLTATPQRLRLMLIEGAIGFARQTLDLTRAGKIDYALNSFQRTREILVDWLVAVRRDQTPLTRQVSQLYQFMINELTRGYHQHAIDAIENVVRLLEEERETWRLVCEQMPHAPDPAMLPNLADDTADITSTGMQALPPIRMLGGDSDALSCFGESATELSIEV